MLGLFGQFFRQQDDSFNILMVIQMDEPEN